MSETEEEGIRKNFSRLTYDHFAGKIKNEHQRRMSLNYLVTLSALFIGSVAAGAPKLYDSLVDAPYFSETSISDYGIALAMFSLFVYTPISTAYSIAKKGRELNDLEAALST